MQKTRKLLGIMIAVILVIGVLPNAAFATESGFQGQSGTYPSLDDAIIAGETEIKLLGNVGDITINGTETDIDITLDLNDHNITKLTILDSTVTIEDTGTGGTITKIDCGCGKDKGFVPTLTMTGGRIDFDVDGPPLQYPCLNNGKFNHNNTDYVGIKVIIKGDAFVEELVNNESGTVEISEAAEVNYLTNYSGTVNINGGTIYEQLCNTDKAIVNQGTVKYLKNKNDKNNAYLTINGGANIAKLDNGNGATSEIKGGTVEELNNGYYDDYDYEYFAGGDVFMSDGTVTTLNNGESGKNLGGNITISGGEVTSMYNYPADSSKKVTIEGGKVGTLNNYANINIACDTAITHISQNSGSNISELHEYIPTYEWTDNYRQCTEKRTCAKNSTHVDVEEKTTNIIESRITQSSTCTDAEITTYTATFNDGTKTQKSVETAQSLGHNSASEWSKDWVNHWHDCSRCDNEEKVAHTFGEGDVCTVCGYKKHEHPICGAACTHSDGENHANMEWQALPDNFTGGVLSSGNYYLTKNVNLTNTIIIESGAAVSICLNEHSLDGQNSRRVIEVKGTLNLTDCKAAETNLAYTAGEIRNGKDTYDGGGVYVDEKGTFNMHGGIIKDNTATNGGGVYSCLGTFNMYGGIVTNNKSTEHGGGLYIGGTFNMHGGSITSNTAEIFGGGMYVDHNSTFNMHGGIIKENTAKDLGGGVYTNGAFNIQDGIIKNNTATNGGGGVFVDFYAVTVTLSGGRIVNNAKNGNPNNIYLNNRKINLEQTMAEDALFGITNTGVFANACNTDYSKYFFSDGGNKVVYNTADKTLAVEVVDNNVEIKGDMIISKAAQASALVVASYDESGKLIDIKTFNIASNGSVLKTIGGTGLSTQNAKTVKAFLWESLNSIKPLVPFAEKTYTSQTNE